MLFSGGSGTGNGISQIVNLNKGNYKFSTYARGDSLGKGAFIFEVYDFSSGHPMEFIFGRMTNLTSEWANYSMEIEISNDMPVKIVLSDARFGQSSYVALDYATLESVPEPSALSLLAIGLGGLAILRRRRS